MRASASNARPPVRWSGVDGAVLHGRASLRAKPDPTARSLSAALPPSKPDWSPAGFSAQAEGTLALGVGQLASQALLPQTVPRPRPRALRPLHVPKQAGKPWPSGPRANDPCHLLQWSNPDIDAPDCRAQGTGLLSKVTPQLLVTQLIRQVL